MSFPARSNRDSSKMRSQSGLISSKPTIPGRNPPTKPATIASARTRLTMPAMTLAGAISCYDGHVWRHGCVLCQARREALAVDQLFCPADIFRAGRSEHDRFDFRLLANIVYRFLGRDRARGKHRHRDGPETARCHGMFIFGDPAAHPESDLVYVGADDGIVDAHLLQRI